MSTMLAIHGALRRDLEQVARIAARRDGSVGKRLQTALGWAQFKRFLLIHHQCEDDTLWPVLRARVANFPDRVAVVDALEEEHALIEPLLRVVDAAASDPADDDRQFGEIADQLVTKVAVHLAHEESDGLDLIDASLTAEEWQRFARTHGERLLGDAPTYVPWLLNGADLQAVESFLSKIPPPLAVSYREQWAPNYEALKLWDTHGARVTGAQDNDGAGATRTRALARNEDVRG